MWKESSRRHRWDTRTSRCLEKRMAGTAVDDTVAAVQLALLLLHDRRLRTRLLATRGKIAALRLRLRRPPSARAEEAGIKRFTCRLRQAAAVIMRKHGALLPPCGPAVIAADADTPVCSICLEQCATGLECGHAIHAACLRPWKVSCDGQHRPTTCPVCRTEL